MVAGTFAALTVGHCTRYPAEGVPDRIGAAVDGRGPLDLVRGRGHPKAEMGRQQGGMVRYRKSRDVLVRQTWEMRYGGLPRLGYKSQHTDSTSDTAVCRAPQP